MEICIKIQIYGFSKKSEDLLSLSLSFLHGDNQLQPSSNGPCRWKLRSLVHHKPTALLLPDNHSALLIYAPCLAPVWSWFSDFWCERHCKRKRNRILALLLDGMTTGKSLILWALVSSPEKRANWHVPQLSYNHRKFKWDSLFEKKCFRNDGYIII